MLLSLVYWKLLMSVATCIILCTIEVLLAHLDYERFTFNRRFRGFWLCQDHPEAPIGWGDKWVFEVHIYVECSTEIKNNMLLHMLSVAMKLRRGMNPSKVCKAMSLSPSPNTMYIRITQYTHTYGITSHSIACRFLVGFSRLPWYLRGITACVLEEFTQSGQSCVAQHLNRRLKFHLFRTDICHSLQTASKASHCLSHYCRAASWYWAFWCSFRDVSAKAVTLRL